MRNLEKAGRLVVVGTPIGNLEDLSPRAARALAEANAIFCEDTRVTAKLASRLELSAPRISCPAPRERSRVRELLERLGRGETVALVSDAGMPGLSDPGERLVDAAAGAGFVIEVVPGPSAAAAALAVCGLPAVPHFFAGFLPARSGERRRALEKLREREETLVWFEAPHRLLESLEDSARVLGARRGCVARELTKLHEEVVRGTLPELAATFRSRGAGRGEITVVVEGGSGTAAAEVWVGTSLEEEIRRGVSLGTSKRELARDLALKWGRPAREIYGRAVAIQRRATGHGTRNTGNT
ncbi:MAG TPA: 16S rRNA (cytidine(1402)-2'-O)-methyltransferase [Thermoanaerobaculia bacterium]|nr:16S rRNA (cytidine(1402)-2'-O)-methyltransferase [Thermoanaerobaculia bacterium]